MRANKYAPDMSMGDVSQYVLELEQEYDLKLAAVIDFTGGPNGKPFVTIGVVQGQVDGVMAGLPFVRQELPTSRVGAVVRVLLNAVSETGALINKEPWLWGPIARARTTQRDAGSDA